MTAYNRILVRPSRAQLLECLTEATAAANEHMALLEIDREEWESFVPTIYDEAEGWRRRRGTLYGFWVEVVVAWWTDHRGDRHFRVRGGDWHLGGVSLLASPDEDNRPPLWHVYPGRMFQRRRHNRFPYVAVCGCGEVGRPEQLAWMGERGTCHDRLQEATSSTGVAWAASLRVPEGLVGFTPDGKQLVLVERLPIQDNEERRRSMNPQDIEPEEEAPPKPVQMYLRDLDTGQQVSVLLEGTPNAWAFSSDGRLFAFTIALHRLIVRDLSTGEQVLSHQEGFEINDLAFASPGHLLAAAGPEGIHLWQRQENNGTCQLAHVRDESATWTFTPDGRQMILWNAPQWRIIDVPSGEPVLLVDAVLPERRSINSLICLDAAGRSLLCLVSQYRVWDEEAEQFVPLGDESLPDELYTIDLSRRQPAFQHRMTLPEESQLSCDGRILAQVYYRPRRAEHCLRFFDSLTAQPLGELAWDTTDSVNYLDFSPDGRHLATVNASGTIKLWPWRALLQLDQPMS